MQNPGRASTCSHVQCFDILMYLNVNEQKASWICPVCLRRARFEDLQIDGFFQDVIDSPRLLNEDTDIVLETVLSL